MVTSMAQFDEFTVIKKLHDLAVAIRASPQRKERYDNDYIFRYVGDHIKLPKQHNPTRWDGVYLVLSRAITIRPTLEKILAQRDYSEYTLQRRDWTMVETLVRVLQPFREVTLEVQRAHSNISITYPMYELLFNHLESEMKGSDCLTQVCTAGYNKLKEYYVRTDTGSMYYISTIINPCYKMEFFKSFGKFKKVAREAIESEYEIYQSKYQSIEARHPDEQDCPDTIWKRIMKPKKVCIINHSITQ
ncbi:hypothetical protein SAMD00019534_126800, partial [Acytostelium subglobosum LB1]|uniref:hypothetical protein n=1 Tax=Acytostelium subglobosum LB1 TaxID=1410327 RepID=UPI0006449623